MQWFKTHHGFTSNRKFGLIADQLQIPRAEVIAIALDVLEYASKQPARGSISGYDIEEAAYTLGLSCDIISNALLALRNRRFCNETKILNWEEYQGGHDATNAERQKRYRERKKIDNTDSVTLVTERNALRNTDKIREDKIRKKDTLISPKPDCVSESVWRDFLTIRKNKRAAVTDTAVKMLEKQAALAGITLEAALSECCARGWQSFKAEWYLKDKEKAQPKRANVRTLTSKNHG